MKIPSVKWQNPWFSVSGKYRGKAAENFDRIFGEAKPRFCRECGKLIGSWCECDPEDKPAPGEKK